MYRMKRKINGMYCIIFCCTGSTPGDGGVRRICQSCVAPMMSGSGLRGKLRPGMIQTVSACDKSQAQRKLAPRNSMALCSIR